MPAIDNFRRIARGRLTRRQVLRDSFLGMGLLSIGGGLTACGGGADGSIIDGGSGGGVGGRFGVG